MRLLINYSHSEHQVDKSSTDCRRPGGRAGGSVGGRGRGRTGGRMHGHKKNNCCVIQIYDNIITALRHIGKMFVAGLQWKRHFL